MSVLARDSTLLVNRNANRNATSALNDSILMEITEVLDVGAWRLCADPS